MKIRNWLATAALVAALPAPPWRRARQRRPHLDRIQAPDPQVSRRRQGSRARHERVRREDSGAAIARRLVNKKYEPRYKEMEGCRRR